MRGAKNESGPAAFFKLELEKFYFLFSSVQSRMGQNWTLSYPLIIQNAHFYQELRKLPIKNAIFGRSWAIKVLMKIFQSELENITLQVGNKINISNFETQRTCHFEYL